MTITDEQRALRAGRIGASDAGRVMAGDWLALWREKTGRAVPEPLDLVAAVQIGIATEHLHPRFVRHAAGVSCRPATETHVHPRCDWLVAHPDFLGWHGTAAEEAGQPPDLVVEAKFSGGFLSDADLARRCHWQLQHQLLVTGLERGLLSILRPSGHALVRVERRPADQDRLFATLEAFWWHVANDVEPADPEPVPAPPPADAGRVLDMRRHNRFAALAAGLMERRPVLLAARADEAALKALMPRDARLVFVAGAGPGQGLCLSRDRGGRLVLRYGDPPRRALDDAEDWTPDDPPALDAVLRGGWEADAAPMPAPMFPEFAEER